MTEEPRLMTMFSDLPFEPGVKTTRGLRIGGGWVIAPPGHHFVVERDGDGWRIDTVTETGLDAST